MSRYDGQKALSDLADKYEPQMEAKFLRAVDTLQAGIDLDRLTLPIADGDVDKAYREVITNKKLKEAMEPLETFIREDLIPKGGRLGAKILNQQ